MPRDSGKPLSEQPYVEPMPDSYLIPARLVKHLPRSVNRQRVQIGMNITPEGLAALIHLERVDQAQRLSNALAHAVEAITPAERQRLSQSGTGPEEDDSDPDCVDTVPRGVEQS